MTCVYSVLLTQFLLVYKTGNILIVSPDMYTSIINTQEAETGEL